MRAKGRKLLFAALLVTAALVLTGSAASTPASVQGRPIAHDELERPTIAQINKIRKRHGLRPLRIARGLNRAAEAHAESMGRRGYFSHTSADGTVFWKRIARTYDSSGYGHWAVGENLLWASPDVSPEKAVRMWLDSPRHRKILLSPGWTQIGLAAVHVTDAPGVFNGRDVTIVTATFGSRSR